MGKAEKRGNGRALVAVVAGVMAAVTLSPAAGAGASEPTGEPSACGNDAILVQPEELRRHNLHVWADGPARCLPTEEWNEIVAKGGVTGQWKASAESRRLGHGRSEDRGPQRVEAMAGNDYELRKITETLTSELERELKCDNRYGYGSKTCNLSFSSQVEQNISFDVSIGSEAIATHEMTLGYDLTWSDTVSVSHTGSVPAGKCEKVKWHTEYDQHRFELWENDVWFDDYIGTYKTKDYTGDSFYSLPC